MSDVEKDMGTWPNSKVEKDVWTGSIDRDFSPPLSISDLGPDGLLYRLEHPETGLVGGHPCQHRGKEMPYFFEYCPFCGEDLKGDILQGVWLPPYGWAPFSGVPKSKRYHPHPLKNPPRDGLTVPGNGPLRLWILPLADGNDESPSYLFAYRPKMGQIYWLPDLDSEELSPCKLEGEREDLKALRNDPLGSARNWSVVWANDHLFFATGSGLLQLRMLERGKIQIKKVFDGTCLATPGMGFDGKIYFPAIDTAGKVGIAHVDPTDTGSSSGWCAWRENNQPSAALFKDVSAPVGTDGGDMHWIVPGGVIVLEGDEGRWVKAAEGFRLIPQAYPCLDNAGIRFCARYNEGEFQYYDEPALALGNGEGVRIAFPYPSGGDGQWFADGYGAEYNKSEPSNSDSPPQVWTIGAWEAEVARQNLLRHIMLATFDSQVTQRLAFEGQGNATIIGLSVSNDKVPGLLPDNFNRTTIAMPIDTILIPIDADAIVVYGGDQSPGVFVFSLKNSRFNQGWSA